MHFFSSAAISKYFDHSRVAELSSHSSSAAYPHPGLESGSRQLNVQLRRTDRLDLYIEPSRPRSPVPRNTIGIGRICTSAPGHRITRRHLLGNTTNSSALSSTQVEANRCAGVFVFVAAIVYVVGKEVVCGIEPIPRETQPLEHSNSQSSQRIRGSLAIRDLIAMAAAAPATTTLYVVQHCWFAGPHHHGQPPVDYMRLLSTLQDAEQVAYASAHWYAATAATSTSTLPNKAAVVRTIQLPRGRMSHHHNNNNVASTATATTDTTTTSSYGFLTCGRLFWVRPVVAKVTTTTPASLSFGEAHCIVTAGLFGNCTSCLPPRPCSAAAATSTEDSSSAAATSLIFVGPHSSHAALQLISSSSFASSSNNSSNSGNHHHSTTAVVVPPGSTVQWVPVGPPPSLDQLAREWPTSSSTLTPSGAFAHRNHNDCDSMDDSSLSSSSKRVGLHNAENEWFRTNAKSSSAQQYAASSHHCNKEHRMWGDEQAAARPPPAKRACRPVQADNYYSSSSTGSGGGLVTTTATVVTTSSCTTSVALGGDMEY
jgi:hypothetical protein